MLFHHTSWVVLLAVLLCGGASLADDSDALERRFAEQLERRTEHQLEALVVEKLAAEIEAIRVPSAVPDMTLSQPSTPVSSATSARALPYGELTALRLACSVDDAGLDCTVAPDPTRGAPVTAVAAKR